MSYAVTNPATGETVKTYDTITDAELEAAIAAADEAHRAWSKSTTVEERAALIRRVGELHTERRQELAELIVREMGKPIEQALGEVDFAAAIYEYYADHSPDFLKDEPIQLLAGEGSAVIRRSSARCAARSHALELSLLPGRSLCRPEPHHRQHDPAQACCAVPRVRRRDASDLPRCGIPARRLREHLRLARPAAAGHRGSARAGRLAHRVGARRRRGRRDRRPPPEEGRARAGRLGPLHPALDRRPRRHGAERNRCSPRQQRPVVQRGQALHRRRRAVPALPREVHREDRRDRGDRPDVGRLGARPAVLAEGRRGRRRAGQARHRAWRDAGARRRTRRRVLPDDRADGSHSREPALTRRSSSAR